MCLYVLAYSIFQTNASKNITVFDSQEYINKDKSCCEILNKKPNHYLR